MLGTRPAFGCRPSLHYHDENIRPHPLTIATTCHSRIPCSGLAFQYYCCSIDLLFIPLRSIDTYHIETTIEGAAKLYLKTEGRLSLTFGTTRRCDSRRYERATSSARGDGHHPFDALGSANPAYAATRSQIRFLSTLHYSQKHALHDTTRCSNAIA